MKYLAQVDISHLSYPGQKIQNSSTLGDLLTGKNGGFSITTFIFFIAGMVFFANLLLAAWDYLLSTGDAKRIASATQRLLNAFVGITIVLASFIIVRIALAILGIEAF